METEVPLGDPHLAWTPAAPSTVKARGPTGTSHPRSLEDAPQCSWVSLLHPAGPGPHTAPTPCPVPPSVSLGC